MSRETDMSDKLRQTLEGPFNNFIISQEDMAQIAGAGLNWVCLPPILED